MSRRKNNGSKIALARKALNLTQKQLAATTGINKATLSQIENGKFSGSLDILERYLDALDLQFTVEPKKRQLPDWDELDTLFGDE
ncbi:MAG: transcriptional regulator with XRE-family HTH domain [Moritella dasanensis]|jgi:transcriptional regulator with XRE-family HTH domain